jgi:hypothetical protein
MKQFVPQNLSAIVAYQEWMDNKKVGKYDLNKYSAVQAHDFPFSDELNSMARLAQRRTSMIFNLPILRQL